MLEVFRTENQRERAKFYNIDTRMTDRQCWVYWQLMKKDFACLVCLFILFAYFYLGENHVQVILLTKLLDCVVINEFVQNVFSITWIKMFYGWWNICSSFILSQNLEIILNEMFSWAMSTQQVDILVVHRYLPVASQLELVWEKICCSE